MILFVSELMILTYHKVFIEFIFVLNFFEEFDLINKLKILFLFYYHMKFIIIK